MDSMRIAAKPNPAGAAADGKPGLGGGLLDLLRRPGGAPPAQPAGAVREIKGEPKIPANWVMQRAADNSYSLAFPNTPKTTQVPVTTPQGQKLTAEALSLDLGQQGAYLLMIQKFPNVPGAAVEQLNQTAIEAGIQNMTAKTPGKIVSQSNLTVDGFPGRDIEFEPSPNLQMPQGGLMLMRVVIANNTLYLVMRAGPKTIDRAEAEQFLDSFRPVRK
jgi:hypothetical protein